MPQGPARPAPDSGPRFPAPSAPGPGSTLPAPPEWLCWSLLLAAFSPVLIDLARHLVERPWAAYCLVFIPLFARELLREAPGPRRPGLGWLLLGVALAAELLLVAGGFTRAARLLLPVAALGVSQLTGRPRLRTGLLLFGFVPVPHALVSLGSPGLEAAFAGVAARVLRAAGFPALVEADRYETTLHVGAETLGLFDRDGGLSVAVLLFGLGWYAGLRWGWPVLTTLLRALAASLLFAPLEILAIALAGGLLGMSAPLDVRFFLDVAPWALTATMALLAFSLSAKPKAPLPSSPP